MLGLDGAEVLGDEERELPPRGVLSSHLHFGQPVVTSIWNAGGGGGREVCAVAAHRPFRIQAQEAREEGKERKEKKSKENETKWICRR